MTIFSPLSVSVPLQNRSRSPIFELDIESHNVEHWYQCVSNTNNTSGDISLCELDE